MRAVVTLAAALGGCVLGGESSTVPDPKWPGETIAVSKSVTELCALICETLSADYAVPAERVPACQDQCAIGFEQAPDACFEMVSCVQTRTLCNGGDISVDCAARSAGCLDQWVLGNGLCRSCWSPSKSVSGVRRRIYRNDSGPDIVVPEDLSSARVVAYLPVPAGEWPTFPGSGRADGTFSIPSVPGCGYFLEVANQAGGMSTYSYEFKASDASLDEDVVVLGRQGFSTQTSTSTLIEFQLTNLSPWTVDSSIEVVIPAVQGFAVRGALFGGAPWDEVMDGATTLMGEAMEWPAYNGLPDATKGDRAYVLQYAPRAVPAPFTALVVDRALVTSPITFVEGQSNVVSGLMETSGLRTRTLEITVGFTEFNRLAGALKQVPALPSGTGVRNAGVLVHTLPAERFDLRYEGPSADLVAITASADVVTDLRLSPPVQFADPMPASWTPQLDVGINQIVGYIIEPGPARTATATPPEGAVTWFQYQNISVLQRLVDLNPNDVVRPLVAPVKNAKIGGRPLFDDNHGAGTTPTISWEPPETGTPTYYQVQIWQRTEAFRQLAAQLRLLGTEVAVPPGVLVEGQIYAVNIAAVVEEADRAGRATIVSGVVLP